MQPTKTLYALLIGINKYPEGVRNLRGCVNDVNYIKEYLQTHFHNNEYTFKPKMLLNAEATRSNIIDGFSHFQQATDGDICFLHYSGHGSRCPAPEEFWHLESDRKHETMVCHDSRTPTGRDLYDKELSFLIAQATKDKDIQFVALMDCCHAGTITRQNKYTSIRQIEEDDKSRAAIKNYYGFEHYTKTQDGKFTPPAGRHILLSACQDKETAKEVKSGGEDRGIFTYCILDALKGAGNRISYTTLISRVRLRIRNKVSDPQIPQLQTSHTEDKEHFFLSTSSAPEEQHYLVAYDKTKKSWILNAGALHGILPGTNLSGTTLPLSDDKYKQIVNKVFPTYALVNNINGFDTNKSYKVKIIKMVSPALSIAFAEFNNSFGETLLENKID